MSCCLPNSALTNGNFAEAAGLLGNMGELPNPSQPTQVSEQKKHHSVSNLQWRRDNKVNVAQVLECHAWCHLPLFLDWRPVSNKSNNGGERKNWPVGSQ